MKHSRLRAGTGILLALGLTAPAIGIAAAPSHFEDVSVRVSFADLDIHSKDGARVLYARLKRASEEVCGLDAYYVDRSLASKRIALVCYRDALEASVEKIESDALSEIHDS